VTDYRIEESYRRNDSGFSSMGVENKYYKDGYWYKQDIGGYEGLAEEVCSMILRHSNLGERAVGTSGNDGERGLNKDNEKDNGKDNEKDNEKDNGSVIRRYVEYEECTINGKSGCRSKNFLREEEELVTFKRLYEVVCGGDLTNKVYTIPDVEGRIRFVIDFVKEYTGVDCTNYLCNVLSFDMLTLNTDRHFHNLALIRTKEGYRECPIFDNGAAFLGNYGMFPPYEELEELIMHASAKPFSGSFEQQAMVLGTGIRLDFDAIYAEMERIRHRRLRAVLGYQLERYRTFFDK